VTDAALHLGDVAFSWQGSTAFSLEVPDFSVAPGEKVFLSGESGSGKSTLLGLICGTSLPRRGVVMVDGTDLTRLSGPARDRFRANRIGVMFQMFNLLPYATALENILLPLAFAPERKERLPNPREAALAHADALGLAPDLVARAKAGELSIGQQQRVAAARALIGGPKLIVADEPTSSLDASTQTSFVDLLMHHVERAGATLLMVSHDDRLAGQFDRVVRIEDIAQTTRVAA
jgi:putative ABC transport system ATP-binding protein